MRCIVFARRAATSIFMAKPPDVAEQKESDDHRKHLEFIQSTITRMSAASSSTKGWLLPVVTAAYGFSLAKREWAVAALGLIAVLLFAFVDANYLKHERRFRALYKAVAVRDARVPTFSMDTTIVCPERQVRDCKAFRSTRQGIANWSPERSDWFSWSIAPLYGGLLVAGPIVIAYAVAAPAPPESSPVVLPAPTVTVVPVPAVTVTNVLPPLPTPAPTDVNQPPGASTSPGLPSPTPTTTAPTPSPPTPTR